MNVCFLTQTLTNFHFFSAQLLVDLSHLQRHIDFNRFVWFLPFRHYCWNCFGEIWFAHTQTNIPHCVRWTGNCCSDDCHRKHIYRQRFICKAICRYFMNSSSFIFPFSFLFVSFLLSFRFDLSKIIHFINFNDILFCSHKHSHTQNIF